MALTRLRRMGWTGRLLSAGWLFLLVGLPSAHGQLHHPPAADTGPALVAATSEPAPFCLLCHFQRLAGQPSPALVMTAAQVDLTTVSADCRPHSAPPPGHRSGRSPPPLA